MFDASLRRALEAPLRSAAVTLDRPWSAVTAARVGGADLDARPWTAIERDGVNVQSASLRGGHIRVVAGTIP